jgi:hypothetical protein
MGNLCDPPADSSVIEKEMESMCSYGPGGRLTIRAISCLTLFAVLDSVPLIFKLSWGARGSATVIARGAEEASWQTAQLLSAAANAN